MIRKVLIGMGIVLIALSWAQGAAAEDAAMVVDLKGGSARFAAGPRQGRQVELMAFLVRGDKIQLEPGTTLVLNYFASGLREEISGPGSVVIGLKSSQKGNAAVKSVKVDYIPARARTAPREAERAGVVTMRSGPRALPLSKEIQVLEPVRTAVRALPVRFVWRPVSGVGAYEVTLTDSVNNTLYSRNVADVVDICASPDLPRGRELNWRVETRVEGGLPARGGGAFYILSPAQVKEVAHAEAYIAKAYGPGSTEALVARAMLYTKYQLNDEARFVLLTLKEKQPKNENLVRYIQTLRDNFTPGS